MKRLLILPLFVFFAGCGGPSQEDGLTPKQYQQQYCEANHWTYEPATNTCKVKEKQ